jgi:NAD+ synthase (glutamine-hydrolysing)
LHDFFVFHVLRYGDNPAKIAYLAGRAFEDVYSKAEIEKWLTLFYERFANNQFKRSVMPDGPKVGSVSLSPRGDWRMPSDMQSAFWTDVYAVQ